MKKRTLIFWGIIIIAVAYIVFVFIFPENKRTVLFGGTMEVKVEPSTFDYKIAYLPEERREREDTKYSSGGKWFWYNCAELDLLNHIVDLKARAIMKSEFIERIINYD